MAGNAVKPPKTVRVLAPMPVAEDVNPETRRILQACSVALRLIKASKVESLADLNGTLPAHVQCSDEMLNMVNGCTHTELLRAKPSCTLAVCSVCVRYSVESGGTAPNSRVREAGGPASKQCKLTPGCPGVLIKAYEASIWD